MQMTNRQDDLGRTLRGLLQEEGEAMRVDTVTAATRLERELTRSSRHRRRVVVAVAALATAAVVVVGFTQGNSQTEDRPAPPPAAHHEPPLLRYSTTLPFFLNLTTHATRPLPDNLVPNSLGKDTGHDEFHYDVSPNGEQLAYTCHAHDPGCLHHDAIVVANLDGTETRTLRLPKPYTTDRVGWSPDGTKLAYHLHAHGAPGSGGLFVHDISTDRSTQLVDFHDTFPDTVVNTAVEFSADGREVLFPVSHDLTRATAFSKRRRWDLWAVPVTGGVPYLAVPDVMSAMPLPDGDGIALLAGTYEGSSIQVADEGGVRRTLVEADESIAWPALSPDGSKIAYQDGASLMLIDVSTGETSRLAAGKYSSSWVDDDTLLLAPLLCVPVC
jgi:dipeptidyl aminopeptidase/acylaminoacyl peptidase